MITLDGNAIFTNTALTDDGDVWWEGMTDEPPAHLTTGRARTGPRIPAPRPPIPTPASPSPPPRTRRSPRSGRTRRACPSRPSSSAAAGASVVPLVFQSFDWDHGVFLGSIMASETTAAAAGAVGNLRRDPFAMLPFCGYNMADYFAHWLRIGAAADPAKLPKIFYVNWFRKDDDGRLLWPGYGENSRVLEWVFERVTARGEAVETPIGHVPAPGAIDIDGLDVSEDGHGELLRVDADEWRAEVPLIREHFASSATGCRPRCGPRSTTSSGLG